MSMTDTQNSAIQSASSFSVQSSSTLWLSLVLVLSLLWCALVMWMVYRDWATGSVRVGAFGDSTTRVLFTLLVLMFFTLS